MKIRTDFVTNSSSSSFIVLNIKSRKICELIKDYSALIQDLSSDWVEPSIFYLNEDDNSIVLNAEECWYEFCLEEDTVENLVDNILDFFDDLLWDGPAKEEMSEFVNNIKENKEEVIEDIEEITLEEGSMGWQGDDENRFWQDWYEKETLEEILGVIAEENSCSLEDVDNDMFCEYVCDKTSEEVNTTIYKKETGAITRNRTTDLL